VHPLKDLATGFLAMVAFIWFFSALQLFNSGDLWLGTIFVMLLVIPVSAALSLQLRKKNMPNPRANRSDLGRSLLFSVQGIVLACWVYDLATTFYAIDITHLAYETHPLGWPWAAVGGLTFYVPTLLLSYFLLFRMQDKVSFGGGCVLAALSLALGTTNFRAGASNFTVFILTASIADDLKGTLLTFMIAADAVGILVFVLLAFGQPFTEQRKVLPFNGSEYFKSSNQALLGEVKQNGLGKRRTATMDRRKKRGNSGDKTQSRTRC
jgi:hypothetical protein